MMMTRVRRMLVVPPAWAAERRRDVVRTRGRSGAVICGATPSLGEEDGTASGPAATRARPATAGGSGSGERVDLLPQLELAVDRLVRHRNEPSCAWRRV